MKTNKGFTLVELLVVMAIIAILASIVVPNLATWIGRGRVTKAVSEIQSIELAISAMLADTERSSLHDLFDPAEVRQYLNSATGAQLGDPEVWSSQRMAAAQRLYTRTTYALLRDGRGALSNSAVDTELSTTDFPSFTYNLVLNDGLVRRLGTNYLPEIGFDPWGQLYNIYPGPWPANGGPVIFRSYLPPQSGTGTTSLPGKSGGASADVFTIEAAEGHLDTETDLPIDIGYPANSRKAFYIWSSGADAITAQAIYQPPQDPSRPAGPTNPFTTNGADSTIYYPPELSISQMGGGDDINNWDAASGWQAFYN